MEVLKTRKGFNMNMGILERILQVMTSPENDGKQQQQIAKLVGISRITLNDYLTEEVWEKIRLRRLDVISNSLADIDRAVFMKAMKGDITAAKLIYSRWEELKEKKDEEVQVSLQSLEEINEQLKELREEIRTFERSL